MLFEHLVEVTGKFAAVLLKGCRNPLFIQTILAENDSFQLKNNDHAVKYSYEKQLTTTLHSLKPSHQF